MASPQQRTQKLHVLAIPYPVQGHMTPLMQFCNQLALKGCLITFVNTEFNHTRLLQSQTDGVPQFHGHDLDIRLVAISGGIPQELHSNGARLVEIFEASEDFAGPFERLLGRLMQEDPPVSFILSDVLLSWTQGSADKFGIPRVAFWTCSAAVYSACIHVPRLLSQENNETCHEGEELITWIPGLRPMKRMDLPIVSNQYDSTESILQFLDRQFQPLVHASWILVNSFYELESSVFDALSTISRISPVGPLLPNAFLGGQKGANNTISASLFSEDERCLSWLDSQKPKSVLYVSFGSISVKSGAQFVELALGLEASQYPFLWVNRPSMVDGTFDQQFPDGYLERMADKSLVVSWVPQLQVLSHASVGGFMTHCGWNSTLESIALGVPLLCWPDSGERRSNARFTVDEWKVGLELSWKGGKEEEEVVGRGEIERMVRELMGAEVGDGLRERARSLSEVGTRAVKQGGDSYMNVELFVHDMRERMVLKKNNNDNNNRDQYNKHNSEDKNPDVIMVETALVAG